MLKLELLPREPFDLAEGSTVGDMRPLAATPAAVAFTAHSWPPRSPAPRSATWSTDHANPRRVTLAYRK